MDVRLEKAKHIVAEGKVREAHGGYYVASASGVHREYRVTLDGLYPSCSCEDFDLHGGRCKHIEAAAIFRAQQAAGHAAECDQPGPMPKKKTYSQDWPNYNAAQINEGYYVKRLLHDLCQTIPEPPPSGKRGRPRLSVRDGIYSACMKVYGGMSARRSSSDLEECRDAGFLTAAPHFNSVLNVLDDPATEPILTELVRLSALPLAAVEVDFAVDSTGFSSNCHARWFNKKYGHESTKATWVSCHAMCGVKTNVITAVKIMEQHSADSPQLPDLARTTSQGFTIVEVSADRAYASQENFNAVDELGGILFAAFRSNTTGGVGGLFEKAFLFFRWHREEYLQFYHKRSNVESTFSALKRKLGDSVRGKSDVSMRNEVLAKVVCYNLTCCIAEWYTLGIAPVFLPEDGCTNNREPAQIIRFPRR
ncbi:MAG TPA: transposase [Gemmataceae bacterium]|nr:transposase [Gemmataceae bacterium]